MVEFSNSSAPIIFDRMYNQAAFSGNLSNSFTWDFGDGSPAVQGIEPAHNYSGTGPYTVSLSDTIYGWTNECFDEEFFIINSEMSAAFLVGTDDNTITLFPTYFGTPDSYLWTFGDGSGTADVLSPTHSFATDGEYEICLTLNFGCGSDQICETVLACEPMATAISATIDRKTVDFQDHSTGTPVSWLWDFGDGNISMAQHPTHSYASDGTYIVNLVTTNFCGDIDSAVYSLTICAEPLTCFTDSISGLSVTFSDVSSELPDSWLWDFGDGNTSMIQNPVHTYDSSGIYIVCLIASNSCGVDTFCNSVVINCPLPDAGFSFSASDLTLDFVDSTGGNPTSWLWDFGDGNSDTTQHPTHTYAMPGSYTITLISFNSCGSDTTSHTITLTPIEEPRPLVSFQVYPNPNTGRLFVEYQLKQPSPVSLEVINLLGKRIYYQEGHLSYYISANRIRFIFSQSRGLI